LAICESWLLRRRHKHSRYFAILEPARHQPLPYILDVGCEWRGLAIQDEQVDRLAKTGKLWCVVYHSFSQRPVEARVVPIITAKA
jgi:hypothetical protein